MGKSTVSKIRTARTPGDMQNFTVKANGTAKATITDARVTMGTDAHSIFSNGGTALVIHAKADDMKTDPSGNAGRPDRVRSDHEVAGTRPQIVGVITEGRFLAALGMTRRSLADAFGANPRQRRPLADAFGAMLASGDHSLTASVLSSP